MRVKPKKLDFSYTTYKCPSCNHKFSLVDLLKNKPIKGEHKYCPKCKIKFIL